MRILTILGARPQFIKAATVSRVLADSKDLEESIVHTGQHHDSNMSDVFFDQLDIPRPKYNLQIAGLSHGAMTGRMLEGIERVIAEDAPDVVLVYGDTNSTLAGALAAAKLHVPVAHVEAGLRSNNPAMPEEINRVVTDRVSSLLLCPTRAAVKNLAHEGYPFLTKRGSHALSDQVVVNVGDVMFDATLYYQRRAENVLDIREYRLKPKRYALCTLHRQENTDDSDRLRAIFTALNHIAAEQPVILPLHPRTKTKIRQTLESTALKKLLL